MKDMLIAAGINATEIEKMWEKVKNDVTLQKIIKEFTDIYNLLPPEQWQYYKDRDITFLKECKLLRLTEFKLKNTWRITINVQKKIFELSSKREQRKFKKTAATLENPDVGDEEPELPDFTYD